MPEKVFNRWLQLSHFMSTVTKKWGKPSFFLPSFRSKLRKVYFHDWIFVLEKFKPAVFFLMRYKSIFRKKTTQCTFSVRFNKNQLFPKTDIYFRKNPLKHHRNEHRENPLCTISPYFPLELSNESPRAIFTIRNPHIFDFRRGRASRTRLRHIQSRPSQCVIFFFTSRRQIGDRAGARPIYGGPCNARPVAAVAGVGGFWNGCVGTIASSAALCVLKSVSLWVCGGVVVGDGLWIVCCFGCLAFCALFG